MGSGDRLRVRIGQAVRLQGEPQCIVAVLFREPANMVSITANMAD
jgi:hypothetical protein